MMKTIRAKQTERSKRLNEPRILIWDIETTNLDGDYGYVLAFGYKWFGDTKTTVISVSDYKGHKKDPTNDKLLLEDAHKILLQADIWVTYYGTGFDLKFVKARMLQLDLTLPPTPHVDVFYTAKTHLKLHSKRLASVAAFLGLEEKTPVSGPIWVKAMAGDTKSIKYVIQHCFQDVNVLEQAYEKLRPYVRQHPAVFIRDTCRSCGSNHLQSRGYAKRLLVNGAKAKSGPSLVRRVQCQDCGRWDTTKIEA